MPKELERRLRAEARRRGIDPDSKRGRAYVYGTLQRIERAARCKRDRRGRFCR